MLVQSPNFVSWKWPKTITSSSRSSSYLFSVRSSLSSSAFQRPNRYAVLGAGFAGLSVAWNLLQHGPKESRICVDIYDEVGIGGGASGVAGGLLHPYSPKVRLLWRGAELWNESLHLLNVAERAIVNGGKHATPENGESPIIRRRRDLKTCRQFKEHEHNDRKIELIDGDAAHDLIPNLSVPLNSAFYMPEALNINAQSYLQGLYLACENLANDMSTLGHGYKELTFRKKSVKRLLELAKKEKLMGITLPGEYDAVIICFGARAAFLPELSGKLPVRACRGIIAQLQLGDDTRLTFYERGKGLVLGEEYSKHSPSILSDAWLVVHGGRHMDLGSTWSWNSINYSRDVTADEASKAIDILVPKASSVYPAIKNWTANGAVAGLRAMPPLTAEGSLPLLGSVDEYIEGDHTCKYWLFTGLGARGLLFHGWLGKVLARAVLSCDEDLIPREFTSWKN
ncbi:hypothetical protein OROMI_025067 [Orobanche minor]